MFPQYFICQARTPPSNIRFIAQSSHGPRLRNIAPGALEWSLPVNKVSPIKPLKQWGIDHALNPKLKPLTLKHNLESKNPKPLPYLPYLLLYMENMNYIYLPNQQQLHSLPRVYPYPAYIKILPMLDSQVPKRKPTPVHSTCFRSSTQTTLGFGTALSSSRRVRLSLLVGSVALVRYVAGQLHTNMEGLVCSYMSKHATVNNMFFQIRGYVPSSQCLCL